MNSENGPSRDPFRLDRLADELALRESAHTLANGAQTDTYELPLLLPLSHDHPLLSPSQPFDVDAFLLSRTNTSLADLRSELREYLGVLKEELVQLINDDYAAFISLRTDLRGEGPRLERLLPPLERVQGEIEKSRLGLIEIQEAVQTKLEERTALREEKALLHLLLKVSDLVGRLENMLLIASPDETTSISMGYSEHGFRDLSGVVSDNAHTNGHEDGDEHRSSVGRAKHLARIAVEFNQLLYHAAKARKQECAFIDEVQKRIDRIESTLSRDLDIAFAAAITSLSSSSSLELSTAARSRAVTELAECLKTYDMLGKWEAAEEVIRQDIVEPFVKKIIHSGALTAPLSPVIPRTPLLDPTPRGGGLLTPSTPYTPYTSHPLARNVLFSQQQYGRDDSERRNHLTLLENFPDDPLVQLLNNVLRFVDRDCRHILDLAERANAARTYKRKKGRLAGGLGEGDNAPKDLPDDGGFDIMSKVLWEEIGRALMEELGTTLFAAGRPDEFQRNYTIVHDFIAALEYAAPSLEAVTSIRSHRTFKAFERRWQLPVYYQLRWKEIIGKLEETLARPSIETAPQTETDFKTLQAQAIFDAVGSCWAPNVFIPELGYRFWRLTLQILSRYRSWLDDGLPARRNPSTAPTDKGETPENIAIDKAHLRTYAHAVADMHALENKMLLLYSSEIRSLLPPVVPSDDEPSSERILRETLSRLTTLIPPLGSHIISILIARCAEPLQLVRSQYRAMNNRKVDLPTEPSYFVPYILRPLREFLIDADGPGVSLKRKFGPEWATEVFKAIVTKYTSYIVGMKKTEDSLRRYKKGKRSTFLLFGSSSSNQLQEEEGRDEARIRAQMVLDVEALGKDASSLDGLIDVEASAEYQELLALAGQTDNTSATGPPSASVR